MADRIPHPWAIDAAEVTAGLAVDPVSGLSETEAGARLARYGPNRLERRSKVPTWRKLLGHFTDPLTYLLTAAVVVSIVVWSAEGAGGWPIEAIVIAAIVIANGLLGYAQTARAEEAVSSLQQLTETTSAVVRDGVLVRVPASDLVPGDVIVLSEGDAVPADARLIESAALEVSEAPLTGESTPVGKQTDLIDGGTPLAERSNMVFSGTAVIRGRGKAIVTATGMDTEMGHIAGLLEETPDQPAPLQVEVKQIGKTLVVAVLIICAVVVGAILLTTRISSANDAVAVLLVGVSLAVAAVPEGLPVILTVLLALGVQRMARRNAIAKRLATVETLGSVSIICSDKTGTLTRGEMTIETIVTGSGEVRVTGAGYIPEGDFLYDGRPLDDPVLIDEVGRVLRGGSLASDARLVENGGTWTVEGDPTEGAFLVAEAKLGVTREREERFDRVDEIPFTSERKMMTSIVIDAERDARLNAVTKGAPDAVLAQCVAERVAGEVRPLTAARRQEILAEVARLGDQALRVIAVAYRILADGPADAENDLIYMGMVGIRDAPRPEARTAVEEAQRAGVRILMITGDHPRTALRIADELGIAATGSRVLTGIEIASMSEAELITALETTAVCARVEPEFKLKIVSALQHAGHIVAMTGDGVNDAPALEAAEIGVAMGITGTDVSKEAADMILADDNFATIVTAIRDGRAILANIRSTLRFLISSNFGEVLTMFLGVLGAGLIGLDGHLGVVAVPLLAVQILWINLLTDTAPALALGLDPPRPEAMSRPPRAANERILNREMWSGIILVGLVMAIISLVALDLGLPGGLFEGSGDGTRARTLAFTTLVLAQLFNCMNAPSDRQSALRGLFRNHLVWIAIFVSLVLQAAVVQAPFLNRAFGTAPLDIGDWIMCLALASLVLWAAEIRKLFLRVSERRG